MGEYDDIANWRMRTKQKLIAYKDGKCLVCGYDKTQFPRAFNFHHRDPNQKDFGISSGIKRYESMLAEVDKCDLLCCRCHAEIHDRWDEEVRTNRAALQRIPLIPIECPVCNKMFQPDKSDQLFCSQQCGCVNRRKVEHPTAEQLQQDMNELNWCQIGRKYGVTDNAARKWAKSYGLLPAQRNRVPNWRGSTLIRCEGEQPDTGSSPVGCTES